MRIDIGLELKDKTEFDQFYVDSNSEQFIRYRKWLESKHAEPLMIAGQIGTGKTTFINYGCVATSIHPSIKIKFDTEPVSLNLSGFIALMFAKTLKWIEGWQSDLNSIIRPEIKEMFPEILSMDFTDLLSKRWIGSKERVKQKRLLETIATEPDLILECIDELLNLVDYNFSKDVVIYAEGIDKFQPNSPDFFELEPVLEILKRHKTLFETNLVHYYYPSKIWNRDVQKIIIPTVDQKQISECLKKRVGQFQVVYTDAFEAISKLSGGNFRQAIRLLAEYEFATANLNKPKNEAIKYATERTIDNFLSYSSVSSDLEVLNVIKRDGFILAGVAQQYTSLIFNNHILVQNELKDLTLSCIVNPLLEAYLEQNKPADSNLEALTEWSIITGTTLVGLSSPFSSTGLTTNYLSSFKTKPLNITEAFNALSSLFLSKNNEIVVLLYKNKEVAEIANDYFLGNVGNAVDLKFNKVGPLKRIDDIFTVKGNPDASIFFLENYKESFLKILDHSRDLLITHNMLWWVKQEELILCLTNWPQLRQFLKIYAFDESILSFLTVKEIEEDIKALKEMGYKEKAYKNYKERLVRVLEYLRKGGSHD
jgi:hypothetical protein